MRSIAISGALAALMAISGVRPGPGPLFAPAPGSPFEAGTRPNGIVAADLNRDGAPDLVTTNGRTSDVSLFLGDGQGRFRPSPGSPLSVPVPPHLAVLGDLSGDREADLVVTSHDSFDVFMWLGDGHGGFRPAVGSPVRALEGGRPHNHALALGDLDGDGDLDITTADDEAHAVAVLLGDGQGRFRRAPGSPFPVGREPYPLALGDVDRDGRPDAVVTHDDISRVTVLLGDGRGGFKPAPGSPFDAGRRLWKAVLHDLDGDRKLDLLGAGGAVAVFLGDGRGRFRPAAGSPYPCGRGAWTLALADFNRDGKADVATADLESDTVTVLLGR